MAAFCRKTSVDRTVFLKWLKVEEALRDAPPSGKRRRTSPYHELDQLVIDFIDISNSTGAPLNDHLIGIHAGKAAQALPNLPPNQELEETGSMHPSWVSRFKRRHGLKVTRLYGELASNDKEAAKTNLPALRNIVSEYSPCAVFNFDETALFWRSIPNTTVTKKVSRHVPGPFSYAVYIPFSFVHPILIGFLTQKVPSNFWTG